MVETTLSIVQYFSNWANAVTTGSADDVWMVRIMLVLRSPKENFQDFTWSGNVRLTVGNNTTFLYCRWLLQECCGLEVTVRNHRLF